MTKSFFEYLDSKGQINKPKVKEIADEVDIPSGRDTKPPKGEGQKEQKPYCSDGNKVKKASEKGFGEEGDKDLKYDPTKKPADVKIPTAECTKIRDAILVNPRIMEHLVNELHRANLIGALVAELSSYRELYKSLGEIMAHEQYGPSVCDRLVKGLKESVTQGTYGRPDKSEFGNDDEEENDLDNDDNGFGDDDQIEPEGESPIDEEPPSDDDLEPGMDGMQDMKKPMPRALEHLSISLRKSFI